MGGVSYVAEARWRLALLAVLSVITTLSNPTAVAATMHLSTHAKASIAQSDLYAKIYASARS